jgi:hypothetical protein
LKPKKVKICVFTSYAIKTGKFFIELINLSKKIGHGVEGRWNLYGRKKFGKSKKK